MSALTPEQTASVREYARECHRNLRAGDSSTEMPIEMRIDLVTSWLVDDSDAAGWIKRHRKAVSAIVREEITP